MSKLKTLVGTDIITLRYWHITIFTFLISFVVLYIFFDALRPVLLSSGANDYIVPSNDSSVGPYNLGVTASDKSKANKLLSDRGRVIILAWSLGLAALIGVVVHFLLIYYK